MNQIFTPVSPAAAPQRDARVLFDGSNAGFRHLVSWGALWEIFTFGFYRFWLTTNMRRHLWTHTSVEGDALEYTGRGVELLLGFLFALAVLVPIYLAVFFVGIEAETYKAFLSVPLALFFYGFSQFAIFRARRYRLTRTLWRGTRFWMTGSGVKYAFKAFGWQLLTFFTLGLAYPWNVASLERYKINNTYYGDLRASFIGKGATFFKRGWWLWLLMWIPVAAFIAAGVAAAGLETHGKLLGNAKWQVTGLFALASLTLVLVPFIYAAFKATEWKWWLENIRFGELRIESDLRRGAFIENYWKFFGMCILAFICGLLLIMLIAAVGAGVAYGLKMDFTGMAADMQKGHIHGTIVAAILFYVFAYLALIQLMGIVTRIYLIQRMWKIIASSIIVRNLGVADSVQVKGQAASAFGEGLADGLDVAGF